jgi:hypothetical protein
MPTFGGSKMISVITPAHNEELFIKKCICSVKVAARKIAEPVELTACMHPSKHATSYYNPK